MASTAKNTKNLINSDLNKNLTVQHFLGLLYGNNHRINNNNNDDDYDISGSLSLNL